MSRGENDAIISHRMFLVSILSIFLLVSSLIMLDKTSRQNSKFKTITTNCQNFQISGDTIYNSKESNLTFTHINYCGGNDKIAYDTIDSKLYLESGNEILKVTTKKHMNLETYLKKMKFDIKDYKKICKEPIYLEVIAIRDNQEVDYRIQINKVDNCPS